MLGRIRFFTSILFAGNDLGSSFSDSSPATGASPGVVFLLDLLGGSSSLAVSDMADTDGFLGGSEGLLSLVLPPATDASPDGVLVDVVCLAR